MHSITHTPCLVLSQAHKHTHPGVHAVFFCGGNFKAVHWGPLFKKAGLQIRSNLSINYTHLRSTTGHMLVGREKMAQGQEIRGNR